MRRYDEGVVRCGEQIFVDFVNLRRGNVEKIGRDRGDVILRGPLRSAEIGDTLVKGIGLPASTLLSDVVPPLREPAHIGIKIVSCAARAHPNEGQNERAALPLARPFQLGEPDNAGPANA